MTLDSNFNLPEAGIEPGAAGYNLPLYHLSYTILYSFKRLRLAEQMKNMRLLSLYIFSLNFN